MCEVITQLYLYKIIERQGAPMTRSIYIFSLSLITLFSFGLFGSDDIPENTVQFGAQSIVIDQQNVLALNYRNYPEWHTYWVNPGDAGLPITSQFFLNDQEIKIQALPAPSPRRYFEAGDIQAFGHSGDYSYFFAPTDQQIRSFEGQDFTISSRWLVCRHVCIPGRAQIKGQWRNGRFVTSDSNLTFDQRVLTESFRNLPTKVQRPKELDLLLTKSPNREDELILYYTFNAAGEVALNNNLLTAYPIDILAFKRENLYRDSAGIIYGRHTITWDGAFLREPVELPADGQFEQALEVKFLFQNPSTGKAEKFVHRFQNFSLEASERFEDLLLSMTPIENQVQKYGQEQAASQATAEHHSDSQESRFSLLTYIIFAFFGGLILNFMPCVLPVISLKLFDLIKNRQKPRKEIFKHNMAYTLGVLLTFIALALVVLFLKSTGEVIGWGFQLQSPPFVAFLIFIIFLFALNLFGLYEFKTPGGKTLGDVEVKKGFSGDMASGVLATILATPCSAPFLGTALTFAFAASTVTIFAIFVSIGLGLALPFIISGIFPQTISFLPRPGMWMEHLKKFLALALILTNIWLIDVFLALTTTTAHFTMMMISMTFFFFFFYSRVKISKNRYFTGALLIIALYSAFQTLYYSDKEVQTAEISHLTGDIAKAGMLWEGFSPEYVEYLQSQKQLTFINFTADWCFTCIVNERVVMNTSRFHQLIAETEASLVLADWTRHEEEIGLWLESQGVVSIPAYFVIQSDGSLHYLGEIISVSKLREYLK